jgi:predicted enzyme related to lactoylglutathione lyase
MNDKVKSTAATSGRFYWHELSVAKVEAAKGFYGELFGWKTRDMDMGPMGTYTVLSAGGTDIGGIAKLEHGAPGWLAYCTVPDVDAAAAKAAKAGARVEVPPTDIPDVGRFAILTDQEGARIAPFRPLSETAEPEGQPALGTFCWNELTVRDPQAATALYRDVFGWASEDKDMGPMGTYTVLTRGERQAAGIAKAQDAKTPSMWLGYVAVADVDASFDKAKRLQAHALVPPTDIPGIGRFAIIGDPQGAVVALFKG